MSLFIVSTPIGNLQDITLRAIETLKSVDLVLCEDTRVTGGLLHHLGIKKEMSVLSDVNEENSIYKIIELLESGKNVALVSDAGTPLISDPGFKLVRTALQKGIQVIPIPGANAITTALSASGLPTDKFLFLGFPPDSVEKKKHFFSNLKTSLESLSENKLKATVVFYESPHKLLRCFDALEEVFGDIEVVVARELTKIYEEFLTQKVSEQKKHFETSSPKGEFVILFRV
ncbi:MAG: 16S rRNA (cytidine(1402)-2'-O)-methyltransferase [Candidatus Levyibacteriota bacterium]